MGTARKQITVNITGAAIETAIQGDSSHCMIADAIRAQFPSASHVSVDLQTIRWSDADTGERYVYLTPRVAQLALLDFDQGAPMEPFSFRLPRNPAWKTKRRTGQDHSKSPSTLKAKATKSTIRSNGRHAVPTVVGGAMPPKTRVGRTRSYGLRGLGR